MHSCTLQQQQSQRNNCCAASSSPASRKKTMIPARTVRLASISSPNSTATTTTTKPLPFPPHYGVADSARSLPRRDVLIVHERRSAPHGISIPRERLWDIVKGDSVKATISLSDPTAAADALASAVSHPGLARLIRGDVLRAAAAVSATLFPGGARRSAPLNAKLEVVARESCPRWHSDHVGCRCLVTYAGPGTLYAPPEAVSLTSRRGGWRDGGSGGSGGGSGGGMIAVDERQAVHVEPFDFLFLKGRVLAAAGSPWYLLPPSLPPLGELAASFFSQNNQRQQHWSPSSSSPPPPPRSVLALGAVHKSPPEASEELPRLVLTVDDACECCA